MTVIFETGTLTVPVSTGNQTYPLSKFTGVTPKLLILFGTSRTAVGSGDHVTNHFGAATSTTNRIALHWSDRNASATSNARLGDHRLAIALGDDGGGDVVTGDFVSFTANQFTINWTLVTIQPLVAYVVIGGSDITNVTIKEIDAKTTTGSQGYTGVGFKPDGAIVYSIGWNEPQTAADDRNPVVILGAISKSGSCRSMASNSVHNSMSNNERWRVWSSSKIVGMDQTNAVDWSFTHTTWDTDGFTLNWDDASTNADKIYLICIKGRDIAVANDTMPTSATTDEVSLGQKSEGVMVLTPGTTAASGTVANFFNGGVGFGDSAGEAAMSWSGDHDDPSDTHQAFSNAKVAYHLDESSNTVESEADLQTLGATSVTLDWTVVSGAADNYIVVGLQAADAAPVAAAPIMFHPF